MKKLSFIVVGLLALSGCSSPYSSTGESLYLKSYNGNKLEVPAPLTSRNISHFYTLPEQSQNARVSIAPNV